MQMLCDLLHGFDFAHTRGSAAWEYVLFMQIQTHKHIR